MQVFVEITSSLGRRLTVTVPTQNLEMIVEERLKEFSQTAKLNGYRPGKIPARVVAQKFGAAARSEAVEDALQSSLREALTQEKLFPAETPVVQMLEAEPGKPLKYSVVFEVYPELQLQSLANVTIEKWMVDITENDVNTVLEQMRKQHVKWIEVNRPAAWGDRLDVDLQALIDGQPAAHLQQKNTHLLLDQKILSPGFAVLIGASVGDVRIVDLPLRESTTADAQSLSQVQVTILKVEEAELPALDETFAGQLGVTEGGLNGLRTEVRQHMAQELEQVLKAQLKTQILEKFIEAHPVELPKAMIEAEYQRLEKEVLNSVRQQTRQKMDHIQLGAAEQEKLLKTTRRRVALGMLFPLYIREHHIKTDESRVRAAVERVVEAFDSTPSVVNSLYENKNFMANIHSQVLEDQVVEHLLQQVQFTEKPMNYLDVMQTATHLQQGLGHNYPDHDDHHDHDDHVHGPDCNHDHEHNHDTVR